MDILPAFFKFFSMLAVQISLIVSMFLGLTPASKVTYICNTEIGAKELFNGIHELYFTPQESVYIHSSFPKESSHSEFTGGMNVVIGDAEGLPIYMDIDKDEMIYKFCESYYGPKRAIFTESIPKISYEMMDSTATILGMQSHLALTEFEGRHYEIWYTKEIPTSTGPYKFNGLPGLILSAKSTDGFVSFEIQSFESFCCSADIIKPPKEGKHMTWGEYKKFRIGLINKILLSQSNDSFYPNLTNGPPENMYFHKAVCSFFKDHFGDGDGK